MITEALIALVATIVGALFSVIPSFPVPSWMADGQSALASIMGTAGSLSPWFPTGLVAAVVATVLACWGVSFAVRVARMVVSHVTGGGGAA